MKKITLLFLSVILILMFTCSCKDTKEQQSSIDSSNSEQQPSTSSSQTDEPQTSPYSYHIDDFEYFSELLGKEELSGLEGNYNITVTGLDTPVVFSMDGMKILTVSAYDKTTEVNIDTYQDESPANIEGAKNVVIIREDLDYQNRSWIITKDKVYTFLPEDGISVRVFAKDDGSLGYRRYWGEYVTSFEQWDTAPLELSSGRDQFLYEDGYVQLSDGKLSLVPQKKIELGDEYDLDAMFEEAKNNGMFAEYENLDAYFAAKALEE